MNGRPGSSPAKLLWQMLRPHQKLVWLGLLLSSLAALFAIGLLALSGWFITATAVAGVNPTTALLFNFFFPSIGVRLLAVLRTLSRYAERLILHDATFRILKSLRIWFYGCIEPLAPANLIGQRSGDLLNRMVADIDALDNFYIRVMTPSLVFLVLLGVVSAFLWQFDPPTSLIALGSILLMGVGLPAFVGRLTGNASRQIPPRMVTLRNIALDTVSGMATWQIFNAQQAQLDRLRQADQRLLSCQRKLSQQQGLTAALSTVLAGAALVLVLGQGIQRVYQGQLSGPLLALILLTVMATLELVAPLPVAYQFWGHIRKAGQRLTEFVALPPVVQFDNTSPTAPPNPTVVYEKISFTYPDSNRQVLENLDLTVKAGEKIGLMGASGCGKTTLAHLLVRFWDPDQGRILIGGQNLNRFSEPILRSMVTLISQNAYLFSGTIRDNLRLAAPRATEQQMWAALENARLAGFVRELPRGLETWIGEQGHLLSGGQSRRLVLARAVLHDAPIWILDEPTEGLDMNTEQALMQAFLAAARNRTLVLISHRPAILAAMDRTLCLLNGRLEPL